MVTDGQARQQLLAHGRQDGALHAQPVDRVLSLYATDPEGGLNSGQVILLRERYGLHALAEPSPTPLWRKFVGQFTDLVIWILIVVAILSGLMREWSDTLAILAIVVRNGVLRFFHEERAE